MTATPLRNSRHPGLLRRTAADASQWFDADALDRSRRYMRPIKRAALVSGSANLVTVAAFVGLHAGPRVVAWAGVSNWVLALALVIVAFTSIGLLVDPWAGAWRSLVHDKRWDLSTQTVRGWALDVLKDFAVASLLTTVVLLPVYAVIRATDSWWLLGAGVMIGVQLVIAFVFPVVVMPVFNKFKPLADGDLRERIDRIAALAGVSIRGSFTMDASRRTRRDNAFVAGFGGTKRVVVYDTMLEHPPHVIEQVVAHEIGHYRLKHIFRSVPLGAVVVLVNFGFIAVVTSWDPLLRFAGVGSLRDPASMPLFFAAFFAGTRLTSVVQSWLSRVHERQADLEALELLGDPGALVDVWRRFAPKNLMDLTPSWWRRLNASHPHAAERMEFARRWGELNGVEIRTPGAAAPAEA